MLNPSKDSLRQSRHRRTFSKTTEDFMKLINIGTPPIAKNLLISPSQITEHMKTKGLVSETEKPAHISEEEAHIRNLISERKRFSKPNFSNISPIYPIKPQLSIEKLSFNSSTTAVNSLEETGISHVIEVLEAIKPPELLKIKSLIIELMERSPEPYFTLVLDPDQMIKGIYYIEYSTGCIHKVIASSDLPMIIPLRKIQTKLVFDFHKNRFLETSREKFDAVTVKQC